MEGGEQNRAPDSVIPPPSTGLSMVLGDEDVFETWLDFFLPQYLHKNDLSCFVFP